MDLPTYSGFDQRGSDVLFLGENAVDGLAAFLQKVANLATSEERIPPMHIAYAGVAVTALLALLAVCALWERRRRRNAKGAASEGSDVEMPPPPPASPLPVAKQDQSDEGVAGDGADASSPIIPRASFDATATPAVNAVP